MTNIGFQQLGTKWTRRFAMALFFGSALGSCNVTDDVVFERSDLSDAGSDADKDGETTILDSGRYISESRLNDQDVTTPGPEGGIDNTTGSPPMPPFECPDESRVPSADECVFDSSSRERSSLSHLISGIGEQVDSIDDCIPSILPYFPPGFEISAEDFETTADNPFSRSPCPQICEAASAPDLTKFGKILLMSQFYYVDSSDENVFIACPLTCERIRCQDALLFQLNKIIPIFK